ncbi:MAG: hypothetical protein IJ849_07800 [Selenomonadaceae bacterium]|nr:hypothetical protein [Selenomonadaceae bacterium]
MDEDKEKYQAYALKIIKADKEKLIISLPFMARAIYALEPAMDTGIVGIGTDGERYFSESFSLIERFLATDKDTALEYLHSVLHCLYLHVFFAAKHEAKIWDLATDISVFDICQAIGFVGKQEGAAELGKLRQKGVALSAQSLYRFFKKSLNDGQIAEAEIERLSALFQVDNHEMWRAKPNKPQDSGQEAKDEPEKNKDSYPDTENTEEQQDSDENESHGYSPDNSATASPDYDQKLQALMNKWKDIADSAEVGLQLDMKAQKNRGDEAGHLLETLTSIKRDDQDYAKFLRKFAVLEEKMRIDMDTFDYNYYHYGLELYRDMPLIEPLEYKEEYSIRDFVIALDTSGSCDLSLIRKFLEKTYRILTETAVFGRQINVHIIQCDAAIQEDVAIHSEAELTAYIQNITVKGRGGTDFRPVFDRVEKIREAGGLPHLRGLIYFTDGYGVFPQRPTDYKTVFAFAEADSPVTVPPWAMKVYIEEEGLA